MGTSFSGFSLKDFFNAGAMHKNNLPLPSKSGLGNIGNIH